MVLCRAVVDIGVFSEAVGGRRIGVLGVVFLRRGGLGSACFYEVIVICSSNLKNCLTEER